MREYGVIGFIAFIGTLFVGGAMVASYIFSYKTADSKNKHEPYECGEATIGSSHIQFKVGYYLFALLFLIFDIESLFLFPCVSIFKSIVDGKIPITTVTLFAELFVFVSILIFGLVYAWKKKVLEWE